MPECITATAVSSAGTQYLETSSFQIFQDTETGPLNGRRSGNLIYTKGYSFCQNQKLRLLGRLGKSRLPIIETDTNYISSDKMLIYFKMSLVKRNDLQNIKFISVTLNLFDVHSS